MVPQIYGGYGSGRCRNGEGTITKRQRGCCHPFLIRLCEMSWVTFAVISSLLLAKSTNAVTVYGQEPIGVTSTAPGSTYTGLAAYDPTVLTPPALPSPAPATQYTLQLFGAAGSVSGLSIPQSGSFYGFSIEVSVINQVCRSPLCVSLFFQLMIHCQWGRIHPLFKFRS